MAAIDRIKRGMQAGLIAGLCAALIGAAAPAAAQSSGPAPLDALHQALHLSAAQEPGWQLYAANMSAPNRTQDRRRAASQMLPNLTAPQRMDLVEAEMKQELADLRQQSQALKAFYMTLSPAQKSTFDAQTLPPPAAPQP